MRVLSLFFALLLALPATAQVNPQEIAGQARQVSQLAAQAGAPENIPLRFSLLADEATELGSEQDQAFRSFLGFFSDSRALFWSTVQSSTAHQAMARLEGSMLALADERGIALDLPPVGQSTAYSPASAVSQQQLAQLALQAERLGTELLADYPGAELLALRDALTRFRVALEEGAPIDYASLLDARRAFLTRPANIGAPAVPFVEALDRFATTYQAAMGLPDMVER